MSTLFDLDCQHQRFVRVADFLSERMVCKECGADMLTPGYASGIRDYYLTGDEPWRRAVEVLKHRWACGLVNDAIIQCPQCLFVGVPDAFDVCGADDGNLFCNQCGVEFEGVECN